MVFLPAGAASPGVSPGTCRQKTDASEISLTSASSRSSERSPPERRLWTCSPQTPPPAPGRTEEQSVRGRRRAAGSVPRWPRPPHHLALLLQDDGLPGSLPQPQGFVVRRRHQVVTVGADGQTPDLPMMTLRGRFSPVSRADLDFQQQFFTEGLSFIFPLEQKRPLIQAAA